MLGSPGFIRTKQAVIPLGLRGLMLGTSHLLDSYSRMLVHENHDSFYAAFNFKNEGKLRVSVGA